MEAATALPQEKETFSYQIKRAMEALKETDGDWEEAAELMREWVDEERELYEAIVEPFIDKGIWDAIRNAASIERKYIWGKATSDDKADGLHALAESNRRSMMQTPMPNMRGKLVGDATKGEHLQAAGFYGVRRHSFAVRQKWHTLIAGALPDDKTVTRKALKDKDLRKFAKRAGMEE